MPEKVLLFITSEPVLRLFAFLLSIAFCMVIGMLVGVQRCKKNHAKFGEHPPQHPEFWDDVWIKAILPAEIALVICGAVLGLVFREALKGQWGWYIGIVTDSGVLIFLACCVASYIAWRQGMRHERKMRALKER